MKRVLQVVNRQRLLNENEKYEEVKAGKQHISKHLRTQFSHYRMKQ